MSLLLALSLSQRPTPLALRLTWRQRLLDWSLLASFKQGGFGPPFLGVTFTQQVDIDSMRGHHGYVRVEEQVKPEIKPLPVKKMGRPRKSTVEG